MIDTKQLKEQTDLLSLAGQDTDLKKVANTRGGEYAGPCPVCGGQDRFHLQPEQGLWMCRQCSDRWQDGIAYIMHTRGVTFGQACQILGGKEDQQVKAKPTLAKRKERPANWQAIVGEVINRARQGVLGGSHWLMSDSDLDTIPSKVQAWAYFTRRGLSDDAISEFKLGIIPKSFVYQGLAFPAGYTIPYYVGGKLYGANVRQFGQAKPKYKRVSGSRGNTLFNAESLIGKRAGFVVEGEFDALLLQEHVRPWAGVVTCGGAGMLPDQEFLGYLAQPDQLYVIMDNDDAGKDSLAKWLDFVGFARPGPTVPEPFNDIGDFWQDGGYLAAWITESAVI